MVQSFDCGLPVKHKRGAVCEPAGVHLFVVHYFPGKRGVERVFQKPRRAGLV